MKGSVGSSIPPDVGEDSYKDNPFIYPFIYRNRSKGKFVGGVAGGTSEDIGKESQDRGRKYHIYLAQN